MDKTIIGTATILGLLSIILGAFGAHALKEVLTAEQLVSFETGVRYQMYHALFLLFVGTTSFLSAKQKKNVFWLTLIGALFFSGSIYLLATQSLSGISFKFLGPITPIGGLFLIIAWIVLFLSIIRQKTVNH
ncbi:DUF423 domain-containing protein [Avrilella dinanensis]|uniref:DUF423 domain-containing protein n=1 Tax=Avrilella dinanensis TaxID=2008672 RepID=A0A2M9R334_9FLAO|nr:DUF423 domain-containing protein [Avrilella dinanensis]PJR03268.1 hypothetical protein CDL10_01220 [Avrilella dinanensis]